MKSVSLLLLPVLVVMTVMMAAPARADVMDVVTGIDALIDEVNKARDVLKDVEQSGDEATIFNAQEELDIRENQLEDARINAIAQEAGVSPGQVREMRASGMGWGKIAKELGVHPSVIGVGKGKAKAKGKKGYVDDDDDDDVLKAYDDDDDDAGKGKSKNKNKNKNKDKGKGKGKK